MRRLGGWLAAAALGAALQTASAETYVLANGKTLEGTVIRSEGTRVTLQTKTGVATYELREFDDETLQKLLAQPMTGVAPGPVRVDVPAAAPEAGGALSSNPWADRSGLFLGVMITGLVLYLIGSLWFIIAGFAESVLWGVVLIVFPGIAGLAFLILHWDRASRPFGVCLLGTALIALAALAVK